MFAFSHNSKQKQSNANRLPVDEYQQFHPIIIKNTGTKKQQFIEPKKDKKKLVKTHSNSKSRGIGGKRKESPSNELSHKAWNSQAVIDNRGGVFDKKLKKDALASEQRRLKAESRSRLYGQDEAKQLQRKNTHILTKQQEIHRKRLEVLSLQQQKQIQKLRKLIEKQRKEKDKNDREYEVRKKEIEAERKQLLELEKQIQKEGPKAIKEIHQKILKPDSDDKIKLKEVLDQSNPKKYKTYPILDEVTQSESIANQKTRLRQQQLQYLIDQRQRNFQQYKQNTLGYTPTLIPLLSRASYKIISTHVSSLVELFVDELLEEQVYLLEAIQLEERAGKQKQKQEQVIKDYVRKLQEFVDETDEIEGKIGRYSKMRFDEIIGVGGEEKVGSWCTNFQYPQQIYHRLELGLSEEKVDEMRYKMQRFKNFINIFDQYKEENLLMFKNLVQEVIQQSIDRIGMQLDRGAGEFVNIVFRSQFE